MSESHAIIIFPVVKIIRSAINVSELDEQWETETLSVYIYGSLIN